MKLRFVVIVACIFFSGCYPGMKRVEVQQGNVIERSRLEKLKPGISREQVRYLLGSPLVENYQSDDSWNYYFYLRDANDNRRSFLLTVLFSGDSLAEYKVDGKYFDLVEEPEFTDNPSPDAIEQ